MTEPMQGRWREPIIPGRFDGRERITWARCRPTADRVPKPVAGQLVGLRLEDRGPVLRARVVSVDDRPPSANAIAQRQLDWNVWEWAVDNPLAGPLLDEQGERMVRLVDDPWWDVIVVTEEPPVMRVAVRESRLPGSAGWLAWKD